jgi:hypothetical protein
MAFLIELVEIALVRADVGMRGRAALAWYRAILDEGLALAKQICE